MCILFKYEAKTISQNMFQPQQECFWPKVKVFCVGSCAAVWSHLYAEDCTPLYCDSQRGQRCSTGVLFCCFQTETSFVCREKNNFSKQIWRWRQRLYEQQKDTMTISDTNHIFIYIQNTWRKKTNQLMSYFLNSHHVQLKCLAVFLS